VEDVRNHGGYKEPYFTHELCDLAGKVLAEAPPEGFVLAQGGLDLDRPSRYLRIKAKSLEKAEDALFKLFLIPIWRQVPKTSGLFS